MKNINQKMLSSKSLYDYLKINLKQGFILKSKQSAYDFNAIEVFREEQANLLGLLSNKKIALQFQHGIELAKWLIVLDGLVSDLYILPFCIDEALSERVFNGCNIDVLIKNSEAVFINKDINLNPIKESLSQSCLMGIKTNWILTTSGTTDTPKLVTHTKDSLTRTVKTSSQSSKFVWGLVYSLTRYAGIQVFLQAIYSNNKLVFSEFGSDETETLKIFSSESVNCMSASPTQWRKYLMNDIFHNLELCSITLGGEIANQQVLNALAISQPKAKIRHIYASTEAGVGFSVTDGKEGFPQLYMDSPQFDFSLKLSAAETLMIKSKSISKGYVGKMELPIDSEGYIDTGDRVSLQNDRYIFMGRLNGSINVGGNKVQPEFVESVLMAFPTVILARVSAKPNSVIGNIVKAEIVVSDYDDKKQYIKELREYCRLHLESFMVPAIIKIVDDISLNQSGKVVRI